MTLTTCPPHSFIDKIIISLYRSILKFFPHLLPEGGPHPAKADCLLLLSIPRTARSDHRKSFLCRCLKNDKTASLFLLGKRFFAFFALFGGEHPRWVDFEKSALKSQKTRMNTEKNWGDIYFVTPSWEGVTKLLSAGLIPFGINLLTQNQNEHSTKCESPVQNRYI